jgi:hypothetical protein
MDVAEDTMRRNVNEQQQVVPLRNPLIEENTEPSFLLATIRTAITIPVVVIWFFAGLYIWIPLVMRRLANYISAVISSAMTRDTDNVVAAGINLEHAISFFFDGFKIIFHSLGYTGRYLGEQQENASIRAKEEFLMSTITWCLILFVVLGFMFLS